MGRGEGPEKTIAGMLLPYSTATGLTLSEPLARQIPLRVLRLFCFEQASSRVRLDRPWQNGPCKAVSCLIREVFWLM